MAQQTNYSTPFGQPQESMSIGGYPLPSFDVDGRMRVYFTDKELLFMQGKAPEGYYSLNGADSKAISRAKIITFLDKYNKVAIECDDIQQTFDAVAEQFVWIEAAGGVVVSEEDKIIMIRRNERWDLPKGHMEEGEEPSECALREAEEETGVKVACVGRHLCTTIHCYNLYGKWEMKQTVWYEMCAAQEDALCPQREEGIIEAKWVPRAEITEHIKTSYPTIKRVFEAFCK